MSVELKLAEANSSAKVLMVFKSSENANGLTKKLASLISSSQNCAQHCYYESFVMSVELQFLCALFISLTVFVCIHCAATCH